MLIKMVTNQSELFLRPSDRQPELLQTVNQRFRRRRQRELARERLARQLDEFDEPDIATREIFPRQFQGFVTEKAQKRELTEDVLNRAEDPDFTREDVVFEETDAGFEGELATEARRRELRKDILEQVDEDFSSEDVVFEHTDEGKLTAGISEEARRQEVTEDILQQVGEDFTREDVVVEQTGQGLEGRISEQAQRRELREDVLQQAAPGFEPGDVVIEEGADGLQARLGEAAQQRELTERVLSQVEDDFTADDVVIEQSGDGFEAGLREQAQRRELREDILAQAGDEFAPGDVVFEETGEGLRAAIADRAVEREQQEPRAEALERAAGEFDEFSADDLTIVERSGDEDLIRPTEEAQRRELREDVLEQAGDEFGPQDVTFQETDGGLTARIGEQAIQRERQEIRQQVRQRAAELTSPDITEPDVKAVETEEGFVPALTGEELEEQRQQTIESVREEVAEEGGSDVSPEDVDISVEGGQVSAEAQGTDVVTRTVEKTVPEFDIVKRTESVFDTVEKTVPMDTAGAADALRDAGGGLAGDIATDALGLPDRDALDNIGDALEPATKTVTERVKVGEKTVKERVPAGTKTVEETVRNTVTEDITETATLPSGREALQQSLRRQAAAEQFERQLKNPQLQLPGAVAEAAKEAATELATLPAAEDTGEIATTLGDATSEFERPADLARQESVDANVTAEDVRLTAEGAELTASAQQRVANVTRGQQLAIEVTAGAAQAVERGSQLAVGTDAVGAVTEAAADQVTEQLRRRRQRSEFAELERASQADPVALREQQREAQQHTDLQRQDRPLFEAAQQNYIDRQRQLLQADRDLVEAAQRQRREEFSDLERAGDTDPVALRKRQRRRADDTDFLSSEVARFEEESGVELPGQGSVVNEQYRRGQAAGRSVAADIAGRGGVDTERIGENTLADDVSHKVSRHADVYGRGVSAIGSGAERGARNLVVEATVENPPNELGASPTAVTAAKRDAQTVSEELLDVAASEEAVSTTLRGARQRGRRAVQQLAVGNVTGAEQGLVGPQQRALEESGSAFAEQDIAGTIDPLVGPLNERTESAEIDPNVVQSVTGGGVFTKKEQRDIARAKAQFDSDVTAAVSTRLETSPLIQTERATQSALEQVTGLEASEQKLRFGRVSFAARKDGAGPIERTGETASRIIAGKANPFTLTLAAERGVEIGQNLPETLEEQGGEVVGETALGVGQQAGERAFNYARQNPARAAGAVLGEVGFGLGASRTISVAGRPVGDRKRTLGATRVNPEELTQESVLRRIEGGEGEEFPGAQDPDLYRQDPAAAVRQQAREFTPTPVRRQFERAGVEEGAVLKKALDVEPEGPESGRAAQGFQSAPGESLEDFDYETPGSFVGPELSPHFLGLENSPRPSPRPGLPSLGGSPTAVLVRTQVRNPDADTLDEFNQEMIKRRGETTARTKPASEVYTGEIEAVIPPASEFVDVGTGPVRGALRKAGIGSDFATEIAGRRVPLRTVAPADTGVDVGTGLRERVAALAARRSGDNDADTRPVQGRRLTREELREELRPRRKEPVTPAPGVSVEGGSRLNTETTERRITDQRSGRPTSESSDAGPTEFFTSPEESSVPDLSEGVGLSDREDLSSVEESSTGGDLLREDLPTSDSSTGGRDDELLIPSRRVDVPEGTESTLSPAEAESGAASSITGASSGGGAEATDEPVTEAIETLTVEVAGEDEPDPGDSGDRGVAGFGVTGDFEKEFSAAVAGPDIVAAGGVEDLGNADQFSDEGVETIDEGVNLRVSDVGGDLGEGERLSVEEIDDGLGDELL